MQWLIIPIVIVVLFVLWWLDSAKRHYKKLLNSRDPVSDEQLVRQYFDADRISPKIPGAVREIFAQHMGYPAEKMLPDDDLTFYWADLDQAELVRDLESQFNIVVSDEDAEATKNTIRSVSNLVSRLRQQAQSL
jgi:acyl carrier protein